MKLYEEIIEELRTRQAAMAQKGDFRELPFSPHSSWPEAGRNEIIFQADVGLELGHPKDHSASLTVWTEETDLIRDNRITLFGPDVGETEAVRLPFGKVVFLGVEGFDEECAFYRQKELELLIFDITLKGYMLRATTELTREWSRISKEALRTGFSLSALASTLIREYKKKDYVKDVEILFLTGCSEDVDALRPLAERAKKISRALSRFEEQVSHDCRSCDLEEVCSDVVALRKMRRRIKSGETHRDA
jgi:CO dehydrogenase/acetyl-CoA synthase beta subunit